MGHMTTGEQQIRSLLGRMPGRDRTVVLIRHSKRPSLAAVPYDRRPEVELTPEGITMAREFGNSLYDLIGDRRIYLLHTAAKRCQMTARALEEGLSSRGPTLTMIRSDPEIRDPIVDLEKFRDVRESFGWQGMIKNWLGRRIDIGILEDPETYAGMIVKLLLDCDYLDSGDVLITVAHDITLFPLIHSYFGRCLTTIGYMNGIVMRSDGDRTEIGFEEEIVSLSSVR